MLSVVLAESALELVPEEAWRAPAVVSDARRREAEPGTMLLDRSFHHAAMLRLKDSEKRGRPDLVHVAALSVTGSPLFLGGGARLYVHTCRDEVLEVREGTRVPKGYLRFRGLAEKLLVERPSEGLVRVYESSAADLIRKRIAPDLAVGLSTQGAPMDLRRLGEDLSRAKKPCLVIGGFPKGHFRPETLRVLDRLVRVDPSGLEAHVVAARAVYEVERAAGRFND